MSKVGLPPRKDIVPGVDDKQSGKVNEKVVLDIINKGGSNLTVTEQVVDRKKNFNIIILESELKIIGELCKQRPKHPRKVISYSKNDWIVDAINEKIERERKKFGI